MEAFHLTADCLDQWMEDFDTEQTWQSASRSLCMACGSVSMEEICLGMGDSFRKLGNAQDSVEWRRFKEGMTSAEIGKIQWRYLSMVGLLITIERWTSDLIIKLLEVSHGQWIGVTRYMAG